MYSTAVILGSGVMAREIGSYLLGRGVSVTWVSTDAARRAVLGQFADKTLRRIRRADSALAGRIVATAVAPGRTDAPAPVVIETTREDRTVKRAALAASLAAVGTDTLIITNSSSILPADIDPRCVGMHFFAPVALTGIVEIVLENGRDEGLRERATAFARQLGLECVHQDERTAFAGNRLLLSVQRECIELIGQGHDCRLVDTVSAGIGAARGQLTLMDRVGIGTIAASVANYRARMSPEQSARYEPMARVLERMVLAGQTFLGGHAGTAAVSADERAIRDRLERARVESVAGIERDGASAGDIAKLTAAMM